MNRKFLLVSVIAIFLVSCASESLYTPHSPRQMAEVIFNSHEDIPSLILLLPEDDHFLEYIANIYLFDTDLVEDGAILFSHGMYADEIAVFRLSEAADLSEVQTALTSYMQRRASLFMGYAPDQARVLQDGIVTSRGRYIALLVSGDSRAAESYFLANFSDNPPALPERSELSLMIFSEIMADDENEPEESAIYEEEAEPLDIYDHALILAAWRSGDTESLSPINRSIVEKSSEVIEMLITNDMDDYQKQLAIHDWIIDWASFDTEIHNNAPTARPHPHNDNPYGVLIGQRGMCSGFTLAFQLFMDMLDIESIVVEGTNYFGDFHSWNMVRINEEWYAVDVTWNNPVGVEHTPEVTHRFFNVSSQFLWDEGHRWDRDLAPEAG